MAQNTTNSQAIIKDNVASMLIKPLEASSVILGSGVQVFNSSAPIRIPRVGNLDPAADFVGESERIPDDGSLEFSELKLMPYDRKSIKAIVRVSNECIRQAVTGVSAELQSAVVTSVRKRLDDALLSGDGTDETITGLLNQTEVESLTFDASNPDTILDAIADMGGDEVIPNRLIVSGDDFKVIRKLKDKNGRYLLQTDLTANAPYQIHGIPVTVTNKLEAGTAIMANMRAIAVVRDIDPTVTILNERYAEYDQVGIRVACRYDLGVIRPEGVRILKAGAEAA